MSSWNLLLCCFVVWCLEVQEEIDSWEGSKPGWDFLAEIPGKLVGTPGWMDGIERETQPREQGRATSCLGASVLERLPVEVMNNTRAKGYKKNPLPSAYFCFLLWVYRVTFKIALSFPLSCPQLKVGLSEHEVLARWPHQRAERKRCYCIVCNINVHMFNKAVWL